MSGPGGLRGTPARVEEESFLGRIDDTVEEGEATKGHEAFASQAALLGLIREWVVRHEAGLTRLFEQQQQVEYMLAEAFHRQAQNRGAANVLEAAKRRSSEQSEDTTTHWHSSNRQSSNMSSPPPNQVVFRRPSTSSSLLDKLPPVPARKSVKRGNSYINVDEIWNFAIRSSRRTKNTLSPTFNQESVRRSVNIVADFHGWVQKMVHSTYFDLFCCVFILGNAILVGVETDLETSQPGEDKLRDASDAFFGTQLLLNLWYIAELTLRLFADGYKYFWSDFWKWNTFDACLVATSIIDLFASSLSVGGLEMGRVFRTIRLFRIVRTLRIVRILNYIRVFRKMIFSLMASVQTLIWSLLLLFFVLYAYSIWFTQGVKEILRNSEAAGSPENEGLLREYYGSLGRSLYSLYMAIFNGKSWGLLVDPLFQYDPLLAALFVSFISITLLGVLNVVTSVFVESAMQSCQYYKDLLVQEKNRKKAMFVKHVRTIFHQIDTDGSGTISAEELKDFIQNDKLQLHLYFEALELNPTDTKALFKLLDPMGVGEIDIEEFCDGCMKLQGVARSFDVNCIMYEQKRQMNALQRFTDETRGRFEHMVEHAEWLERAFMKLKRSHSQHRSPSPAKHRSTQGFDELPPPRVPCGRVAGWELLSADVPRPDGPVGPEGGAESFFAPGSAVLKVAPASHSPIRLPASPSCSDTAPDAVDGRSPHTLAVDGAVSL